MKICNQIDESILKRTFGLKEYEKGLSLLQHKQVSSQEEIYPNISVCTIHDGKVDHIVLQRNYPDNIMLDCDCGTDECSHIVATLISSTSLKFKNECDPAIIEEIEDMIAGLVNDILSDHDYDEEANFYESWEMDKYGLENNNGDVEYTHVSKILEEILSRVGNPDTAMILIDKTLLEYSKLEYDNDGAHDALFDYGSDISVLFTHISAETIATLLKNTDYTAKTFYKQMFEHVSEKRLDEAYQYLDSNSILSDFALEMYFKKENFDAYINCSCRKCDAIVRVVEFLDSNNNESSAKYAKMLIDYAQQGDRTVASILSNHGYKEEAARMYKKMFEYSHYISDYNEMCRNSELIDADDVMNKLLSATLSRGTFDITALTTLVNSGKGEKVDQYIHEKGFAPDTDYEKYYCKGINVLCESLLDKGFIDSAAIIGRGLIELRLDVKDSECYIDAVNMLKFMDSRIEFENLDKPHSEYKKYLMAEYPKMRKFWGLYNGTWPTENRKMYW